MKALDAMLPANAGERRTLADIIFSKLDNLESGQTASAQAQEKHHGQSSTSRPIAHAHRTHVRAVQTLTVYQTRLPALILKS